MQRVPRLGPSCSNWISIAKFCEGNLIHVGFQNLESRHLSVIPVLICMQFTISVSTLLHLTEQCAHSIAHFIALAICNMHCLPVVVLTVLYLLYSVLTMSRVHRGALCTVGSHCTEGAQFTEGEWVHSALTHCAQCK